MSMKSPLGRVRGLGSAKEGVHHWWMQRLTALALVPLALWFVGALIGVSGTGHAEVAGWIGHPFVAVTLSLLIFATFYHAALGLQVVYEDYIHHHGVKIFADVATKFACFALGAVGIFSVLKIAFGS